MKKRLFIYCALIICAGLLCFFAASVYVTYSNNLDFAKDVVAETAQIYADLYTDSTDLNALVKAAHDIRLTIIAPDGKVLADSSPLDVDALENHLSRPEIQAAAGGVPAPYIRRSATLGVDLMYYALKVPSGASYVFIRTAIPVTQINAYLFRSLPLLALVLPLVALLCLLLARGMAERITRPLSSLKDRLRQLAVGEYTQAAALDTYEEVRQITREIDEVALLLQKNLLDLQNETGKLDYILNNIGDGLFAVDEKENISLINTRALEIFNASTEIIGKNLNYLTYDKTLAQAVDDCARQGKNALFELNYGSGVFLTTVKYLAGNKLTMAVLTDVTESRANARQREEFFANASHELKTPLTAVKGFNELTSLNNTDERLTKYIDGISHETERMLSLIGDMLKLSELENTQNVSPAPVALARIAEEVRETLSAVIAEKAIVFELSGEATVMAEPGHVYELVKNLIENAVRYNRHGGKVAVTVESDKKNVRLSVADNGIGIAEPEQARIFERFYRVEKSRSSKSGGTGLGLSIVKHICALYDWQLSLKSKPGLGTEVTVIFTRPA